MLQEIHSTLKEDNDSLMKMMREKLSHEMKESDLRNFQDIMLSKQQEQNENLIKSQVIIIESLEAKCASLENDVKIIRESFNDGNLNIRSVAILITYALFQFRFFFSQCSGRSDKGFKRGKSNFKKSSSTLKH